MAKEDQATRDHNRGQEDAAKGKYNPPTGGIAEAFPGTRSNDDYNKGYEHGKSQK